MYGAWHVHFESPNDTGNNLSEMLDEFESIGAKRVTVTEHDVFTSFIDLRDLCRDRDLKVIPGVEGTMSDLVDDFPVHNAHMILVAKDKIGLRSLSKIITEANRRFSRHPEEKRPIITWKNLEENVEKGHLYYSTACIQGIFGQIVKSPDVTRRERREKAEKKLGLSLEERAKVCSIETSLKEKKAGHTATPEELALYKKNHKLFLHYKRYTKELEALEEIEELPEQKVLSLCDSAYAHLCRIFGAENVYFELQNHGILAEQDIYPKIARLVSRYHTTNVLLANDVHVGKVHPTETDFIRRNVAQYSRYHTVWDISDGDRELYIKDDKDLMNWVSRLPGVPPDLVSLAMENTKKVLMSCETDYLYEKHENHYPGFSDQAETLLREKVEEGKRIRFPEGFPSADYDKRLQHELDVICGMGYADYHLIVQDYDNWTKKYGYCVDFFRDHGMDFRKDLTGQTITMNGVSMTYHGSVPTMEELDQTIRLFHVPKQGINIGPGRGSAVSSLVCYLLGISDIDPIRYNLLFERFLNPERKSMPDIDCDFRPDLRDKAIEYTKMKYGENSTCKIITKSYGALAGNLRLAARYLGEKEYDSLPVAERLDTKKNDALKPWYRIADQLSKGIDKKTGDIVDIKTYNKKSQTIYDLAKHLDGLFLTFGQHAGGNIISRDDITDTMPFFWNEKKQNFSTQCTHDEAEAEGFLKMDFLGLINLGILTDMMELTGDNSLMNLHRREELLNDRRIYDRIFSTGDTQGVFQFESDGMKEMLREFQPECFEDLILLVSVYRPGPLQYKDEIIATKKYQKGIGKKPKKSIDIPNETLNQILKPTYGCIIYQEQVMQIFEFLAGYSLGDADLVRRAMAKKNLEKLSVERETFLHGDEKRNIQGVQKTFGLTEEELSPYNALFDQMLDFASYAFNKSHAAAYSLVSFFTAYFKCYHPGVFYAVSLNYVNTTEEVAPFAAEMRHFGLHLAQPDFRYSKPEFWFNGKDAIYYGYTSVKGMDKNLRISNKNYPSLKAFWEENPLSLSSLTTLTKAGFFRSLGSWKDVMAYWEAEVPNALKRKKLLESDSEKKEEKLLKIPAMQDFVPGNLPSTARERYNNEFLTMGLVFPHPEVWKRLQLTHAFPEGKDRADAGVVICFVNTEKTVKSRGKEYYETYLMDQTGTIKKYLSDEIYSEPDGLFYLSGSPWSLSWQGVYRKELPTAEVVVFSSDRICRGDLTDLLCRIRDREPGTPRYAVLYGNESIRRPLGVQLTKAEYRKLLEAFPKHQKVFFCDSFRRNS